MSGYGAAWRITTRGYYDRRTGESLRQNTYSVYPPGMLGRLAGSAEVAIMVHGMRNDSAGAASKIWIASERLRTLGYVHPVIGFSYDADVVGAHIERDYPRALGVARTIAEGNGPRLAAFLKDFSQKSPRTAVRILGHSLGSEVVLSAARSLGVDGSEPLMASVHLFAASVARRDMATAKEALERAVSGMIKNYYHTGDEELAGGHNSGLNPYPIGLCGAKTDWSKLQDISVSPENHRFASYAAVLDSFP